MSTQLLERQEAAELPEAGLRLSVSTRLFTAIAAFAMIVGAFSFLGGIAGAIYTWDQAADQSITTPGDAVFAEVPVRGPVSMWAQSDIITKHQLESTGGQYFAEMEREVPVVDEAGQPVLDENGEPVMGPNELRASWVNATALTTALGLGVMTYALSAFAIVVGLTVSALGFGFLRLRKAQVAVH